MPSVTTQLISGDVVAVGSPAQIPLLIVPAGLISSPQYPRDIYTFQPGQDATATLGGGLGADQSLYLLRRTSGFVTVAVAPATWSAAPSLTHTGTGSALISLQLAAGAPGILDDFNFLFTVKQGGTATTGAIVTICYDGSTVAETISVPAEPPGQIQGASTAPITPTTLATAQGLALHFDAPSNATATLTSSPSLAAAPAGLKTATATVASPVTLLPANLLAAGLAAILANGRTLTFTTAGTTPSDAPPNVVITGSLLGVAQTETLNLSQTAGAATSTKVYDTITSLAYASADGTGATIAVGYGSAFASVAELITAWQAALTTATLALTASATQASTGAFLTFTTTATGATATVTLDATPGTAATLFGFTANQTASGSAALYPLANTGAVAVFPATSAYVTGDTFSSGPVLGPRMSIAAITAAAQAAHDNYAVSPFGFVTVGQPADTASNCQALDAALEALRVTWLSDPTVPRDEYMITGSPWHTPSATVTTNETNIATADSALLGAFNGRAATLGTVAVDDCYLPGSPQCRPGLFRRTAAIAAAVKRAGAAYLAQDLAEGSVPEISLKGPDGLTRARNENTATNKLGGLGGPGFSVLRTMADGSTAKFVPGATRAGATNRLRNIGDVAAANETARLTQALVETWDGQRPAVDATPGSTSQGQLTLASKGARADAVDAAIRPTLRPEQGHPNCSDFTVTVSDPPTGKFVDNGRLPVKVSLVTLGEVQQVDITVALSGTTITTSAIPGT